MQRHGWWMVCVLLILVVLGYGGPVRLAGTANSIDPAWLRTGSGSTILSPKDRSAPGCPGTSGEPDRANFRIGTHPTFFPAPAPNWRGTVEGLAGLSHLPNSFS